MPTKKPTPSGRVALRNRYPQGTLDAVLRTFVWELENHQGTWENAEKVAPLYGRLLKHSFMRQFSDKVPNVERIRMSALGMPVVYQMLPVLGYGKLPEEAHDISTLETFHYGDAYEARVFSLLKAFDPSLKLQNDKEVIHNNVYGHADILVQGYGETAVLEVKTVNSMYFSGMVKRGYPTDDRGYFSQLAMYSRVLGVPGYWLVKNKETHQVVLLPFPSDLPWLPKLYSDIDRKIETMQLLLNIKSEHGTHDALLSLMNAFDDRPEPITAYITDKNTRQKIRFDTLPENMKYCPRKEALYELGEQEFSKKAKVLRVFEHDEVIANLESLDYGTT